MVSRQSQYWSSRKCFAHQHIICLSIYYFPKVRFMGGFVQLAHTVLQLVDTPWSFLLRVIYSMPAIIFTGVSQSSRVGSSDACKRHAVDSTVGTTYARRQSTRVYRQLKAQLDCCVFSTYFSSAPEDQAVGLGGISREAEWVVSIPTGHTTRSRAGASLRQHDTTKKMYT